MLNNLNNKLIFKKISKKITIISLVGAITLGSLSFNANAAGELGFFGNIFDSCKKNVMDALGYNQIKKYGTFAGYGLAGFLGYKLLAKPLACNIFGAPAKVATKVLDTGIKWSLITGFIGIAIYLYHLYNKKELLNAIENTNKNVTKTREDILADMDMRDTRLTNNMNTRFDGTDAQLGDLKNDTKNIKENTKEILSKVNKVAGEKVLN